MKYFEINKGTSKPFIIRAKNKADGTPFPLTGYAVDIYDESPELAGQITIGITDIPGGIIEGLLNWDDAFLMGKNMSFRISATVNGIRETSPAIFVVVK